MQDRLTARRIIVKDTDVSALCTWHLSSIVALYKFIPQYYLPLLHCLNLYHNPIYCCTLSIYNYFN